MIEFLSSLNPQHRETLRTIVAFLDKRLAEQGTIDWALQLKPNQHIERIAVRYILASQGTPALSEPWLTAWRLIEESWSLSQSARRDGIAIYDIQKRLAAGDRSGALVAAIVDLVAPRLKVEPVNEWQRNFIKKPRRPKMITSLLSSGLTSGDLIDLSVVDLAKITETDFLIYLANALESAVINGLDIARRLGWDGKKQLWRLGDLGSGLIESTI